MRTINRLHLKLFFILASSRIIWYFSFLPSHYSNGENGNVNVNVRFAW